MCQRLKGSRTKDLRTCVPKTPLRDCRHSLLHCFQRSLLMLHPIHTPIRTIPFNNNPFSLMRTCRCRGGPAPTHVDRSRFIAFRRPVDSFCQQFATHYSLALNISQTAPEVRLLHPLRLPASILSGVPIGPIYLSCSPSLFTGLEHHQRKALRPHHPQRQVHIVRS